MYVQKIVPTKSLKAQIEYDIHPHDECMQTSDHKCIFHIGYLFIGYNAE